MPINKNTEIPIILKPRSKAKSITRSRTPVPSQSPPVSSPNPSSSPTKTSSPSFASYPSFNPTPTISSPIFPGNPRQPNLPSQVPSLFPTIPTIPSNPSNNPTVTSSPSDSPTITSNPSNNPTVTISPSDSPIVTSSPSNNPTVTTSPSDSPTVSPSINPTVTLSPSDIPSVTSYPTVTLSPSDNPTVTSSPSTSSLPSISSFPSNQPSNCYNSENGRFGNGPVSISKERLRFRYELILNATYLSEATGDAQGQVDVAITEAIIIPRIESRLSDALFPVVLQKCNRTDTDNLSMDIVGISDEPDDVIVDGGVCNSINTKSGNICYPIDGEMSIFFQTDSNKLSRRLQRGQQDILQLKENTRLILDGGQLHDAHAAIISIESKATNANPTNNLPQIGGSSVIVSSPSNWWIYILITAGIGLLIVLAILVWQKIKNRRNQQNDDYSASAFYEQVLPETI